MRANRASLQAEKERTNALQAADNQRADALIAASSGKAYEVAAAGLTHSLLVYEKYGDWSGFVHAKVERGKIYALSDRLAAAQKDLDEALEAAKQKGSAADRALALESIASLHVQLKETDAAALYDQALEEYNTAGNSSSVARLWEWKGEQDEKLRQFDTANESYGHALDSYRIAGDWIGVTRTQEEVSRTVAWGFLVDPKQGHVFAMRGDRITVGRNSQGIQNDLSFASLYVSRRHLVISHEGFQADDVRSRNGTAVNADRLPYGLGIKLSDGDVISFANREVLQFTTQKPAAPTMPPSTWAIFIDGNAKSYTYLTSPNYSISLTLVGLKLEEGTITSSTIRLRHDQQKQELFILPSEWDVLFESNDNLPTRLVRLSADRKQILEEGPAFQIVTIASD